VAALLDGISVDSDDVELLLLDTGETLRGWLSYSITSSFTTPTDEWTVVLGGEGVELLPADKLLPGTKIRIFVAGCPQLTGYIDRTSVRTSRDGGTVLQVQGRDTLAPAVDGCVDPKIRIVPSMTCLDLVAVVLGPYGFVKFTGSDDANRNIQSGINKDRARQSSKVVEVASYKFSVLKTTIESTPTMTSSTVTELVDPTAPGLHALQLTEMQPHFGEGAIEFCQRVIKRLGLTLRVDALGDTVIVSGPNWNSTPTHRLVHTRNGVCSYTEASIQRSTVHQPSIIIAQGSGGGGIFARGRMKVAAINELTGLDELGQLLPSVADALGRWPEAQLLPLRQQLIALAKPPRHGLCTALYLVDDESRTLAQLQSYVRRELANRQKTSTSVTATVYGHTQAGAPYAVGTLIDFEDDVLGLHEPMWVLERTFAKSRGTGTTTSLNLIRRWTLDLTGS
jgi:hypothetical protein